MIAATGDLSADALKPCLARAMTCLSRYFCLNLRPAYFAVYPFRGACLRLIAPDNADVMRSGVLLNSSVSAPPGNSGATLPLIVWLLPQLAALSLSAGRVPLWARFPQPGELLALQFLIAAQMASASLCFPFLLRDARATACVLTTGWPMALIAAGLAAAPLSRACVAETYVSLFLTVLTIWRLALRHPMGQAAGAAVASMWTVGGAMLLYLRAEFSPVSPSLDDALAGPLVAAVHVAGTGPFFAGKFLLLVGVLAVVGGASCVVERRIFNSGRITSNSA